MKLKGSFRKGRAGRGIGAIRGIAVITAIATLALGFPSSAAAQLEDVEDVVQNPTPDTGADTPAAEAPSIKDTSESADTNPKGGSTTKKAVKVQAQPSTAGEELVRMRTRDSRTFTNERGSYVTEVFPGSIHFRGQSGWNPIDNTLTASERAGWALQNRANRYRLLLPRSLGNAPVRFELGGDWATFSLDNARGSVNSQENSARYAGALEGVDVEYEALNDLVREKLILHSPASENAFTWTVRTSPSITPVLTAVGGVDFVTDEGSVRFEISPPEIHDSSSPGERYAPQHRYSLTKGNGGHQIALRVDPTWLNSEGLSFPVIVDPPIAVGKRDCWISSGSPGGNYCAGQKIRVGSDGTDKKRALVEFDVSQFPDNAQVLHARFGAHLISANNNTAAQINLRRVTEKWDESVTWNSRDSTGAAWSPGGVFDRPGYNQPTVGAGQGRKYWYPTELVNNWIAKGPGYNDGLILKLAKEDTTNQVFFFGSFDNSDNTLWPELEIEWDNGGMGELKNYTQETRRLTDRTNVKANVAGGNNLIKETDLVIRGVNNHDLKIERYYNSLKQTQHVTTRQSSGEGWTVSPSSDTGLVFYTETQPDNTEEVVGVALHGPSGYRLPFTKDPISGEFDSPNGLAADLTYIRADNEYRLKFRNDERKMFFSASTGLLLRDEDKNQNKIEFSYTGDRLTKITDTQGRETTLTYETYLVGDETRYRLWKIQDPAGREHLYRYEILNEPHLLSSHVAPGGATTTYGYNTTRDLLTSITDAEQRRTVFTYSSHADTNRFVTKIGEVTDQGGENATTFYYSNANADRCTSEALGAPQHSDVTLATVVLNARGQDKTDKDPYKTRYCYDDLSRVEIVVDGNHNVTRTDYTADANVEYHRNAKGAEFGYSYDQTSGNLIGSQGPDEGTSTGGSTEVKYQNPDHPHFPTLVTDMEGHQKKLDYDAEGNLVKVIEGFDTNNPVTFGYEYDEKGNLTRVRAPESNGIPSTDAAQGNDTILTYYEGEPTTVDGDDHMLHTIDHPEPLGDKTFTYDPLSRNKSETDGKNQTTNFTYDLRDRADVVTYSDGTALDYDYDLVGNPIQRKDIEADGSTRSETYDYNERNLLKTEKKNVGTAAAFDITYTYNKVSSLTSVDGPHSNTSYTYDNLDLVKSLTAVDETRNNAEKTINFSHNALYARNQIDYPGGISVLRRYWNSGKLKKVIGQKSDGTTNFRELKYDFSGSDDRQKGLLQKLTDLTASPNKVSTYNYDGLGRLKAEVTKQDGAVNRAFRYNYDPMSNLTCQEVETSSGAKTFDNMRYNSANQLTATFSSTSCGASTPAGATTYSYDPNGNLQSTSAGFEASYDARDHTEWIDPEGGARVDMNYVGPTQEERTTKAVNVDDATAKEVEYTRDILGIQSEVESTTTTDLLGTQTTTLTTNYIRDPQGEVLGYSRGALNRYFVRDMLGSVIDVVNAGDQHMEGYTYTPYGELWWPKEPTEFVPFRFAQGYMDTETGLQKHGVRYYDPAQARFTQLDPLFGKISDPITLNRYQYSGCNPANNLDPTGRYCSDAEGIAALSTIFSSAEPIAVGGGTLLAGVGTASLGLAVLGGGLLLGGLALATAGILYLDSGCEPLSL